MQHFLRYAREPMTRLKSYCLLAAFALCACSRVAPTGTAIENVTVIDAINGVRAAQTVVFDGDKILYVGSVADAPDAAKTIDASGQYLIPGLWDMHVHLTFDERLADVMPGSFLRYGVTSVRDTGGLLANLLPMAEHMRSPEVLAPRVFFSGPLLDGEFVVYDGESAPEIGTQNTSAEQARENVNALKDAGASFIKIYEMVSPEVFDALVTAAVENDLPIAAHVPLALTASGAGPSVGSMEHLRNIELDCASNWEELHSTRQTLLENGDAMSGRALRAALHQLQRLPAIAALDEKRCADVLAALRNTIQVPTAALNTTPLYPIFERDDWQEALASMPEAIREEWAQPPAWLPADKANWDLRFARYSMRMIDMANEAGIPIGAGTDTPLARLIPGYSLLHELEILVRAGLTPMQAIEAATVQPAAFLSLLDEMGSIDPGKRADLVLLSADPLDDIGNIRKIELVVAQGREVPRP